MPNIITHQLTRVTPPAFLIAGAQKAGTSALFAYLSAHPEILPPTQKEIDFFWLNHLYEKGISWYEKQFPTQSIFKMKRCISFEASPHYLFFPVAAKRIARHYPKIKFILLLRHPVYRAFAQFQMYQRNRISLQKREQSFEKYNGEIQTFYKKMAAPGFFNNFDEAVQLELKALNIGQNMVPHLIKQGLYEEQLRHLLQYFPREQLLIIDSTQLKKTPQNMLNQITRFLGLRTFSWTTQQLKKHNKGHYTKKINSKTYLTLKAFYKKPNEALFNLIGRKFDW